MTLFPLAPAQSQWVQEQMNRMSLRQKVGQLFCPIMMHDDVTADQQIQIYAERLRREIDEYSPAGYYLNRYYMPTTPLMLNLLQKQAKIPLFICSDMESGAGGGFGGVIAPGLTRFPNAMGIGATGSEQYAYLVGQKTAIQARTIGVNWIFAPVLDVNNNPDNPIINVRSYGEDPEDVSRLGSAYIMGLQEHGVTASAKHFPGHGDTTEDSHILLSKINADRERLQNVELFPYYRAIQEAGVYSVMTAHLSVPALEPKESLPATLSSRILQDLLRKEMGFEGLIVSDALLMGGVTTIFDPGEAAVRAFLAGVDLLLMPPDLPTAYNAVLRAVESGEIGEERLHESLTRILSLKATLGLNDDSLARPEDLHDLLEHDDAEPLSYAICSDSITLVKNDDCTLPISYDENICVITLFDDQIRSNDEGEAFHQAIRRRSSETRALGLNPDCTGAAIAQAERLMQLADTIIFAMVVNVLPEKDTLELPDRFTQLIETAINDGKNVILISFGNPYLLRRFPEVQAYLCAWSYYEIMAEAVVEILFGERIPHGKLPVTIPGICLRGEGLSF